MDHALEPFRPVANAVAMLFHPHAEVTVHDIARDRIFHIANAVSGRKAGDGSNLDLSIQDLEHEATVIGPYENSGKNGQRVRSITAVLRNADRQPIGLMCINLDHSSYEPALELLERLIRPPMAQPQPEILFQNDWRDQIKLEIRHFLESRQIALEQLTPALRKDMVAEFDSKGLFFAKKSIEQLAALLGVSRATAYNDLNAARKMENGKKPIVKARPS